MKRYQGRAGGSTNKRITFYIKEALEKSSSVDIYALKPEQDVTLTGLKVDLVKGLEYPLISLLGSEKWNISGNKK